MERIHFVLIYSEIQTCITVIISNYTLYLYCTFGCLKEIRVWLFFPLMLFGHFVDSPLLIVLHLVVSSETEKYKVNSVHEAFAKCFVVYILNTS